MKSMTEKQKTAQKLIEESDARTIKEQLKLLAARPGDSRRETSRLKRWASEVKGVNESTTLGEAKRLAHDA